MRGEPAVSGGAATAASGASGSNRTWFPLLVVAAVLSQTALNLARPLISYRVIGLGGHAMAIGLATAAYAMLPVLAAVPLGRLSDRTRRSWTILAVGTGLIGLGSLALSITATLATVAAAGAILGLGHLVFMIAAQGAVANLSGPEELDRNFGWFTAAVSAGQLIGPALSGLLRGGVGGAALGRATTTALWVAAVIGLVGVPLAMLSRVRGRGRGPDADGPAISAAGLVRLPGVAGGLFVSLALLASVDLLTAYLPLVAQGERIVPIVVGVLLSVRAAASIGSRMLLARLLARFSRTALVTSSCVVAGMSLAVVSIPGVGAAGMAAALLVGGFFLGLGQPLTMTQVVRAVPETARSTTLALRLLSNRVGQVVLPGLAGFIAGPVGAAGALWLASGVLALGGVVSATTSHDEAE